MDTALITDARQIMRSRLRGRIPSPSHFLCRHRYLYAWNSASCLPAPGFHLLMIRAVFSASDDNVLSALWEISVFWRDSFGLVRNPSVSLSIFISVLPPNFLFFPGSLLSFYPTFLLTIPSHSLFLYLTCLSRFFSAASQRRVGSPISLLHTLLTLRLSPPSPPSPSLPPSRPPSSISTPRWIALTLIFIHTVSPRLLDCPPLLWLFFFPSLAVPLSVYTPRFNIPSSIPALPLNALSLPPRLIPSLALPPPSSDVTFSLVFWKSSAGVRWCASLRHRSQINCNHGRRDVFDLSVLSALNAPRSLYLKPEQSLAIRHFLSSLILFVVYFAALSSLHCFPASFLTRRCSLNSTILYRTRRVD